MPSAPIAIAQSTSSSHSMSHLTPPKDTAGSLGSSISQSPQTPFVPPPSLAPTQEMVNPANASAGGGGIFRWASSFSSTTKPPIPSPPLGHQKGIDIPTIISDDHDDHHGEHDSFEFGDLATRSWGGRMGRRAVSMSVPSAVAGQPGGIARMLSGFGATNAPASADATTGWTVGSPPGAGLAPMPTGGLLADKAAKGQGLLRRLSIGAGGGFKPPFVSPPVAGTNPPQVPANLPALNTADLSPPPGEPLQRANTVGSRGRRFSEVGSKKRGVSPMGEKMLRDHF